MNPNKMEEMIKMFLQMTAPQMEHVYLNLKHKIPGIDQAYKAAKNIRIFTGMGKESPQK